MNNAPSRSDDLVAERRDTDTPLPAVVESAAPPRTLIRPTRGWQLLDLQELWRFRELLWVLALRDIKVRYKETVLGAAWAILQPLMLMAVFTLFFNRYSGVPTGDVAYPLFVYSGLLAWTFFATAVANAGNSVVASRTLVTKIYFPRLVIPLAAVGGVLVDFLVAVCLLPFLMLAYGQAPGWQLVLVPVIFAGLFLLAVGVGTLLAALNVKYRDFRYVIPFLIQIWLFATPTIYTQVESGGSGWVHVLAAINPVAGYVAAFRAAALGLAIPWEQLALSALSTAVILVMALLYFRKAEDSFADII